MPHRPEDDWTRPIPRSPREPRDRVPSADDTRPVPAGGWDEAQDWDDWQRAERERGTDGWAPTGRPPDRSPGRSTGATPVPQRAPRRRGRPRYRIRRFVALLLVAVLAWTGALVWAAVASLNAVDRVEVSTDGVRPAPGAGTNVLLIGTDARTGLTPEQRAELRTGSADDSARADTIMLLHMPGPGSDPILLSIPRDSFVTIPGYGQNKVNAAYSLGGAPLMVQTVEQATGLRTDGYIEIGFDGFVDVVAAVGGVQMCLPEPVFEERSNLDLPAGCQRLEGGDALSYVRMRYADPRGDLGRVERQREFLAALVEEMVTPSTLLVPWELHEAGTATGRSMTMSRDTSMLDLARVGMAMRTLSRGGGVSTTVPVADPNYPTGVGSAVLWDEAAATAMFEAMRRGSPVTVDP